MSLHPLVSAASRGVLPPWAEVSEARVAHMARVVDLLEAWARKAGIDEEERARWVAAGWLHDCLKEADEERLRELVDPSLGDLPAPVLHGPAAAARMRSEGVDDDELLLAVAFHTLGHAGFGRTGRALYAADFLEPGRDLRNEWRAGLRARMPADMDDVVGTIVRERILHLVKHGRPVRPETWSFWNRFAGGDSWARASEV